MQPAEQWHMQEHSGRVPEFKQIPGELHQLVVHGVGGNPNVFLDPDGIRLRAIVRTIHFHVTTNWLVDINENWSLANPRKQTCLLPAGQIEDLRMFHWQGRLWAIAATHPGEIPPTNIRQALLELNRDASQIVQLHIQASSRCEKNWMPCVDADDLRFVYSTSPLITVWVDRQGGNYFVRPGAHQVAPGMGYVRGGSQLVPWDNGWIALVHRKYRPPVGENPLLSSYWPEVSVDPVAKGEPVVYQQHFARFDGALTQVSYGPPFYFKKVGVEFGCGLTWWGDKLIASFGIDDREGWVCVLSKETVRAFL